MRLMYGNDSKLQRLITLTRDNISQSESLLLQREQLLREIEGELRVAESESKRKDVEMLLNSSLSSSDFTIPRAEVHRLLDKLADVLAESNTHMTRMENTNHGASNESLEVSYLGVEGSYSFLAATDYFKNMGARVVYKGENTFKAVIGRVEDGKADYGLLPIENTTSGSINEAFDVLQSANVHVVAEIAIPIEHMLLAKSGTQLSEIKSIYSHPQALQQCSKFLARLSGVELIPSVSSASASKFVADSQDPLLSAIGSDTSARLYGLQILKFNIGNEKINATRFFVVATKPCEIADSTPAKTTIVFFTTKKVGALVQCIEVLKELSINMSKLESRPSIKSPDLECFYIDIDININDVRFASLVRHLREHAVFIKVLGCYPRTLRL